MPLKPSSAIATDAALSHAAGSSGLLSPARALLRIFLVVASRGGAISKLFRTICIRCHARPSVAVALKSVSRSTNKPSSLCRLFWFLRVHSFERTRVNFFPLEPGVFTCLSHIFCTATASAMYRHTSALTPAYISSPAIRLRGWGPPNNGECLRRGADRS